MDHGKKQELINRLTERFDEIKNKLPGLFKQFQNGLDHAEYNRQFMAHMNKLDLIQTGIKILKSAK